jgi:hypothetical protein
MGVRNDGVFERGFAAVVGSHRNIGVVGTLFELGELVESAFKFLIRENGS